jgi:PAS domain S-box-containing protein
MARQHEDGRINENILPLDIADIVRLLDVALIASTLDGTITVWNPAAARLLQYTAHEMTRNSISRIIRADQPDEIEFISTRITAGEVIKAYETAWIRKDGRAVDVSLRVSPMRDATGRVGGILWFVTDITERNRLRRAERDQSFLEAIIESAEDAVISKDLDGIITTWNAAAEKIFGYTAQEVIGKPVTILIPSDHPDEETQILERLRGGERIQHYETRRLRKDGRVIDVSLTISPIKDRMGRIVGASKIAHDITERKRWRTAEVAESFLAAIVDSAEDAIISKDLDGIVTSWNPAAEKLYGYTASEMIGKPIAMLIPSDHRDEEPQILQRIRRGERIRHYETQRVRKDGGIIEVSLTVSPIKDSLGRIIGASKIARDITDRKVAEAREKEVLMQAHDARWQAEQARQQAEAASLAKDEFLATISHELRTPITAVLGWSRMLLTGQLTPERQQKALETIDRNARSQAQLIEDLLDISRIVSGKLRIDRRTVDLAAKIASAVEAVRPPAEAKRIRIESIISSGAGPILGDSERLQQVVWNLLSNALKFTPRDGFVTVELRRVESQVELYVADNGIGISPDFLPHVFDRFSQADSTITRTRGGLGMGLAIVKSLVELHGGIVSAFSKGEGQGTTFCVKLPISVVQRQGGPSTPQKSTLHTELKASEDLVGLKILVVDDEPDTSEMISFVFNQCGAIVKTAGSVKEALEIFDEWSPELLVSDIGMPNEDGYHLIRAIRQERGSRIPAVALTALARVEDRIKALMTGYQMHVSKPVEPVELITIAVSLVPLVNRRPDSK